MKTLGITASPYATQYGTIEVPDDLSEDQYQSYVSDHFDEIKFNAPDLDYAGTDLEIEEE